MSRPRTTNASREMTDGDVARLGLDEVICMVDSDRRQLTRLEKVEKLAVSFVERNDSPSGMKINALIMAEAVVRLVEASHE